MATINKGILLLTPFYHPNIGGVETHLTDLATELSKTYKVFVHTYSPITTINVSYKKFEKQKNLEIHRYPWFGKSLFHKLEKFPIFDFLYLTPYLFIRVFLWMIFNSNKIDMIHVICCSSINLFILLIPPNIIYFCILYIHYLTRVSPCYYHQYIILNKIIKQLLCFNSDVFYSISSYCLQ